jgi:23S rRNA pseudouridine2605 synthase
MKTSRAPGRVTLPRALSKLGMASRSQSIGLIESGVVSVNGKQEKNPHRWVDIKGDRIELKSRVVRQKAFRYLILNKPPGCVTTKSDERGEKTVFDILGTEGEGLSPVGRLDAETSGLLLFTNDNQFANQLTSPDSGVEKTYVVELERPLEKRELLDLSAGIEIEIGGRLHRTKPARVAALAPASVEMTISEGKNRQIRRMMESLGHQVVSLKRISLGPLGLENLREGEYRPLTAEEVQNLKGTGVRLKPVERKQKSGRSQRRG